MKLCIATAVFDLRKSRGLDYYLRPTIDFLEDFAWSDVSVCVFTDQPEEKFPKADNIHIYKCTVDDLIKEMWDSPDWKEKYTSKSNGDTERCQTPELVAVWLGKMSMMKIAATKGDVVLWQDSGIVMSQVFDKDSTKYKKVSLSPEVYKKFVGTMLETDSMVFMRNVNRVKWLHGVNMFRYRTEHRSHPTMAGLMVAKSSEVDKLLGKVKSKWELLLSNGDYGTEENAITLCCWEDKWKTITSTRWVKGLGMA